MNERDVGETGARGRRAARVRWRWPAGHWVGVDEWVAGGGGRSGGGEGAGENDDDKKEDRGEGERWWRRGGRHTLDRALTAKRGGAGRARALDSKEGRCGEGRAPGGKVGERGRDADDDSLLTLPRLAGKGDGKTKLHLPKGETKG